MYILMCHKETGEITRATDKHYSTIEEAEKALNDFDLPKEWCQLWIDEIEYPDGYVCA